jgi:hypothetical protein
LEDARAMNAMGQPLNTNVMDRGMVSERCEKLVVDTIKAAGQCRQAVRDYLANQNVSAYAKLKQAHKKLGREIAKTFNADGDDRQLAEEKKIARAVVEPRCFTAFEKWADIIDKLEGSESVTLTDDPWPTETHRDDDKPEGGDAA